MKVLVTGAGGFIGRHLTRALLARGEEVHGTCRSPQAPPPGLHPHLLDLRDGPGVTALLRTVQPEVLFHLAARVDVSRDEAGAPARYLDTLLPALHVLSACDGVRRVVMVGTCEEYGHAPAPFREEGPAAPVSPYSAAKLAATELALSLWRSRRLPVVVVRPFLTYGPGMPQGRLLADARARAHAREELPLTPGEQRRDVVWVGDVVQGLLSAADVDGIDGQLFNLASGVSYPALELARAVYAAAGAPTSLVQPGRLPYRPGEIMDLVGDPGRAARALGWRATTPLSEGLKQWESADV